jgi:hypothetical protein
MSANAFLIFLFAVQACVALASLSCALKTSINIDRFVFLGSSGLLIVFSAFRPLGLALDDGGYTTYIWEGSCPTLECGRWFQGERDQLWYSLVGLLKSVYPHPQVMLWLAGFALAVKLFVIDRLCRHRSLALVFYVGCFYVIHDITALRLSLAISAYLLGFYWLVEGCVRRGAWLLAVNGLFHKQAFLAPSLLIGRWVCWSPASLRWALLLPMGLLTMAVYPNDSLLKWLVAQPWGQGVTDALFGKGSQYLSLKLQGYYDKERIWPVVAPPTLLLAAWLLPDLLRGEKRGLFRYVATSLVIAAWFLWGFAVIPEVQLRFWHFFLVPFVFVIGNAQLTRWKLAAILALSAVYLMKYTVMHDLLLDQRRVHWALPVGGGIALQTPGIAREEGDGFNVTQGSAATLQATAELGYRFAGWSGACQGVEPICTLTVDVDLELGAQFVKTAGLSLSLEGQGAVTPEGGGACQAACDMQPDRGAEIRLKAAPADGCLLGMTTDQSVTARFVRVFPLAVVATPGGQVKGLLPDTSCAPSCNQTLDGGSLVKLEASADPDHRFSGWEGGCSGVEPLCELTLDAAKNVKALFVPTVPLTITRTGEGVVRTDSGAVQCGGVCRSPVDAAAELVLLAEPAAGWRLAAWGGACAGAEAVCRFKPEGEMTVTATFVRTFSVQLTAADGGEVLGAVSPAQPPAPGPWQVDEGGVLLLTPVAPWGVRFDHWTEGCTGTGLCALPVTQSTTVAASFRPLTRNPLQVKVRGQGQVTLEPGGWVCGPAVADGRCRGEFSDVTLRAVPAAGYVFNRWVWCAAGSSPVCTTTLRRSSVIEAEFAPVPRHEVRVTVTGPGAVQGLAEGPPCAQSRRACRAKVVEGSQVVLTAVPAEGHFLVGWSGACAGRESVCRVPVRGGIGVGVEFR